MRSFAILLLLILFSLTVFPQKTKTTKTPVTPVATPTVNPAKEKEEFGKAVALTAPLERIAAFQKFIKDFPKSTEKTHALELIVSARGQIGDEKLRNGETESGIAFFRSAVQDAPTPISDQLFAGLILQFPTNLFSRGQNVAAIEIAKLIEEKIGENPKQLTALASYYLGVENGSEAKRIAEKAIQIETNLTEKPEKSNLPAAYQVLGLASRLNFDFTASADAYVKALELDPASTVSRRGLAEVKRALGKADEAAALYREILAKDAKDATAQTGLILSLFDAGKKQEAETEMAKSLAANPNNLFLLVGAAYWYAAHADGAKAIELAQKALALEPRYTWTYIALARGYMAEKKPLEAERILLSARQYGDFPTLDYELATARVQAGFFREAADILKRSFAVKDDYVKAWIGNRVPLEATSFFELLAVERQASIFAFVAADNSANSEKLKALLELAQKLDVADAKDDELAALGEKFINGEDDMKLYRQIFVAKKLLEQKKALPKILELTQSATAKVDAALTAPNAASAILADALYESRTFANVRGQVILIPNIAPPTLSKILRGEIEEIAGWTLQLQNKPGDAVIRLKRALSVLPPDSTWWRSSQWRLGAALEADGKSAEALEAYIKCYLSEAPDGGRYLIIEALYQKVHGNTEGLAQKIGNKPALISSQTTVAQKTEVVTAPSLTPTTETKTEPTPTPQEVKPVETPTPSPAEIKPVETPSPTPTTEIKTQPPPTPQEVKPVEPTPAEIKPVETPSPTPTTEIKIEPTPSPTPNTEPANTSEAVAKNQSDAKSETETKPVDTSKKPTAEKPLFEPVIITIPKPTIVNKSETETKPVDKPDAEKVDSGEVRVRKVNENKTEEIPPCTLVANQETISILANGGSLGILIGFEKEGDLKQIKAESSSPADIEIIVEPDIREGSGLAFFLIRSISTKTGAFTVTFEAPCGKKEVMVKVR
jgi:Flp pilus assembly protein TadD